MRGFVVLFDTRPEALPAQPDPIDQSLANWEQTLDGACLKRRILPNCRFYLYSHRCDVVPAEFNQKLNERSDELSLWVGPRVDTTDAKHLQLPTTNDLDRLSAAVREGPSALDGAICVSYRAKPYSLVVKTDLLNSTYIYWTQSGRWLLLSNSSLTLARITDAYVNWVAASEFLASGSIYGNHSLYKDIRTLRPATLHVFTGSGAPSEETYWRLDKLPFNTLSAREACARVLELLDKDFQELDATGKTFILDLTGGYDSRTNLGLALRRLHKFETTVSGLPGDEDVLISSSIARHFGFKHKVISHWFA